MRPPRYRFPEEVRSTTRAMASRMVSEDTIARTPKELDVWIWAYPEVREALDRGGWRTEFTSEDLLPLLHVFVAQAGGAAPPSGAQARSSRTRWPFLLAVAVAVGIVLGLLAMATGALSR